MLSLAVIICLVLIGNVGSAAGQGIIISAYQGPCQDGNLPANLETVYRVIDRALALNSDFLCFPETYLSGYFVDEEVPAGYGTRIDDPEVLKLIDSTAGHDMVVLVGIAERGDDDKLYNTVMVMYRGQLLGTYSKIMLTRGDHEVMGFRPGRAMPVFEAKGVKFASIICKDSSHPETALLARHRGAQILFSPHYNSIRVSEMDDHRIHVRNNHIGMAALGKMIVVRANVINVHDTRLGYGDSAIFDIKGAVLARAPLFGEALITAVVSREMLEVSRKWQYLSAIPEEVRKAFAAIYLR